MMATHNSNQRGKPMETNDDPTKGRGTEMSLTLGKVSGDLLIRRWGNVPSETIA